MKSVKQLLRGDSGSQQLQDSPGEIVVFDQEPCRGGRGGFGGEAWLGNLHFLVQPP